MKTEINAAVNFLVEKLRHHLHPTLSESQVEIFQNTLSAAIASKFENHWYEDKPLKGSAYRCIQITPENNFVDPVLKDAIEEIGLCVTDAMKTFGKGGISIWIDPFDVSCRLGTGAIFPVYRKIAQSKQPSAEVRQHRPQQRPRSISPPHESHETDPVYRPRSTTPPGFSSAHAGQMYQDSQDTTLPSWSSMQPNLGPNSQGHYESYLSAQLFDDSSFSFNQYSSYYQAKPAWKRNFRAKPKPLWQDQESYERYHWSKPANSDEIPDNVNDMLSMQRLQEVY